MEDLQTYRARIGLYRHRLPSKQNVPSHKRASYRQLEQKRRQDRTKLKKSRMLPPNKLNPVASSGKMAFGITRGFAIIVIAILLMAGLTSGHTESVQSSQEFNTYYQESHVNGNVVTRTLQHNYVMLSSTCDCLLGNAGVHAYNGNPQTPPRDDSENMDWAANADTPSGSQLEVGGAERSTLQRSQLADHIQKLEIDIRKQHADMIRELNGYISPELKNEWNLFQNGLTPYLARREIYGSCVTFVGDHCEFLFSKGIIQLGEYSVLFDVVNPIDERAGDIVKRATTAIKEIRMRISAIKLQARSDRTIHSAEETMNAEHYGKSSDFMMMNIIPHERTIDVGKRDNMINQTESWIKWNRKQSTFITTDAFKVAIDILKKTNLLLIRGNCGDGKSALAMEIMAWLMGDRREQSEQAQYDTDCQRKKPLLLKELKSWDETISCNANLAIFVDDMFGYSSIYSEDLAWWKKISPFIRPVLDGNISNNANCMILTVRNDVYAEHKPLFSYEDVFTDNECVVDLSSSHSLQTEEKKKILRLYWPRSVELSTDDETTIVQSELPFGFPECCRLFQKLADMQDQPSEYFVKPLAYIKKSIRERFSKRQQAGLLFLLLSTGKFTVSQQEHDILNAQENELVRLAFDISLSGDNYQGLRKNTEAQTIRNIIEGLKSMIGSLVKLESNTFTFYHDAVEDAVAILYGEISSHGFLRNVDITHLRYIATLQDVENALYIGDENIECLYIRLLDELNTRGTKQYDILTTLRVWDDGNFVRNFIAWTRQQKSVPKDFYFQWTTEEYTVAFEKGFPTPNDNPEINYFSFFVFVAKSNKCDLLQQLIEQGKSNAIQMKLALDQACVSGSLNCALSLMENGITPDCTTWISVVKGGSLVLLNALISSDMYPHATTDDKTFNVENINLLQLACLYEKEQIALRLAQNFRELVNHRDKEGNSMFHHIAMTNNYGLFENITATLCLESQDLMPLLRKNNGVNVLHEACISQHQHLNDKKTNMCKYLCETYPHLISQIDNRGMLCLHYAAFSGDVDCFMYLDNLVRQHKSETERKHYMEILLTSEGVNILHVASLKGNKAICTHICQRYPSLISQRDNGGRHCLHYATNSGDVDCFMYLDNLVNQHKSETERQQHMETLLSSDSETVLHRGSIKGNKAMCTHICQMYPSLISQRDNWGRHCLHHAAHSGNVDCFMYLANLVNQLKSKTERQQYIETLLTSEGVNMLHVASLIGNKAMCTHLCQMYPSLISQRNNQGFHCLHYAAHSGNVDCFMYLDDLVNQHKSETERQQYMETLLSSDGETVLHRGSLKGNKDMCTHLCQMYPSLISQRDNRGMHCLHSAAYSGDVDCFMYLDDLVNQHKSETERQQYMETLLSSDGETVLHLGSLKGNKAMCTHICQMYPSLISQRNNKGIYCLHYAALSGDVDCFMYLDNLINQHKSETERQQYMETLLSSDGETVLHLGSLEGKKAMCTHICQMYPSLISQRDNRGMHCHHSAAYSGDVDCFMYLDDLVNQHKSETERQQYMETLLSSDGETVLHLGSLKGKKAMCTHLCQMYPSLISQRENSGRHCLHNAAHSGDVDCFMYLDNLVNQHKSETERQQYMETLLSSDGETVLHRGSLNGNKAMCTHLCQMYPSLISQRANRGIHCLHHAAHSGNVDCFMYLDNLVNQHKNETERQQYMERVLTSEAVNVLHGASLIGNKAMCTHLCQMYPSLISQRDNWGRHCLHLAAESVDVDGFMYLDNLVNQHKSETERQQYMETLLSSDGETVLHRGSLKGNKAMCTHICQMYPSLISQRDNRGKHCLHNAANSGNVDCFMYLDNLVNQHKNETERQQYMETFLSSEGETVLHRGSLKGEKAMCTHLCQMYPSLISQRNNRGGHCLHLSAQSGDVDCFMYLDNLVNQNKSETERQQYMETLLTSEGVTVLHQGSLKGNKAMCTHLCQMYPSLISQRDNRGRHCLHNAAQSGYVDGFMYLDNLVNQHKSETERQYYMETLLSSDGETVLHRGSLKGNKDMCTHICQMYPSLISQRENRGRHCLHNAAHSGDVDCFMYLDNLVNQHKSETERQQYMETLRTSIGQTVLHVASINGTTTMCTYICQTYPSLISQ